MRSSLACKVRAKDCAKRSLFILCYLYVIALRINAIANTAIFKCGFYYGFIVTHINYNVEF
jgi:hypothetical protein